MCLTRQSLPLQRTRRLAAGEDARALASSSFLSSHLPAPRTPLSLGSYTEQRPAPGAALAHVAAALSWSAASSVILGRRRCCCGIAALLRTRHSGALACCWQLHRLARRWRSTAAWTMRLTLRVATHRHPPLAAVKPYARFRRARALRLPRRRDDRWCVAALVLDAAQSWIPMRSWQPLRSASCRLATFAGWESCWKK